MRFKQFYLNETSTSEAKDMENVIVDVWNSKKLSAENLQKSGDFIVKFLKKSGLKGKGEQLGRGSFPLTKDWKKWGATNTTPKTDLTIGKTRVSLKVAPAAQLMSGGKEESLATFMNALQDTKLKKGQKKMVDDVLQTFEKFVKGTIEGKVGESLKAKKDKVLLQADKAHKDMMKKMGSLFEQNEDFKIAFAAEAMSGFMKFGKKETGSATHLLTVTKDGSNNSLHLTTDKSYSKSIADKMKLSVRFKSSSEKLKGVKTGKSRYWSVVGLVVNKLNEELKSYEGQVLNEGIIKNVLTKIKNFIVGLLIKIKDFIAGSVQRLVEFLQINPVISFDNNINFLSS